LLRTLPDFIYTCAENNTTSNNKTDSRQDRPAAAWPYFARQRDSSDKEKMHERKKTHTRADIGYWLASDGYFVLF
jgi:hypothetical protein